MAKLTRYLKTVTGHSDFIKIQLTGDILWQQADQTNGKLTDF